MVEIEEVESDDDENNNNNEEPTTQATIQLGFSEPLLPDTATSNLISHRSPRWWKDWDGGQVGGQPSWLQPRDLPQVICQHCPNKKPLQFVCQLYAPLDHTPQAFHRSLYVFGCPTCCHSSAGSNKGIRVLRVQLPEENPFYPPESEEEGTIQKWTHHKPMAWGTHVCQVCGQKAAGKCPLQQRWFCGKMHQKEYKKYSNHSINTVKQDNAVAATATTDGDGEADNAPPELLLEDIPSITKESTETTTTKLTGNTDPDDTPPYLPSVYTESELVVDEEPPVGGDNDEDEDDDDDNEIEQRPTMFPSSSTANNNDDDVDGHDSDEDLDQEDLNEMVTGKTQKKADDPVTNAFYKRIQDRKVPEQCLRYSMEWRRRYDPATKSTSDKNNGTNEHDNNDDNGDSQPLWIRSEHQPDHNNIPPCPYCQAPRAFEFQLMPQMIHFLHQGRQNVLAKNANNDDMKKKNETAKQALIAAQSIIENAEDPSHIPPSFADAKAKAMQALEQDLFHQDGNRVDWGVVAIYTCTASCCGAIEKNDGDNNTATTIDSSHHDPLLGTVYREEYAWLQPALDI